MIDLSLETFNYSNHTFNVSIKYFDKLTNSPIKVINHKTNNERIFKFVNESKNYKKFKCDNLLLIVRRYEQHVKKF